jgi:sigma-B regulation protein RsbU (phosphoserine phosphatase)
VVEPDILRHLVRDRSPAGASGHAADDRHVAGARMLTKEDQKEAAGEILGLMQKSVARMSALIDNVLDFARGRLGSGIALKRSPQSLQPVLNQVIAELRTGSPARKIETTFDLTRAIDCDGGRIAQLFSNLLLAMR